MIVELLRFCSHFDFHANAVIRDRVAVYEASGKNQFSVVGLAEFPFSSWNFGAFHDVKPEQQEQIGRSLNGVLLSTG